MVPILETDYAQLTLDQEKSVLKLVWKTDCTSETYHFVYNKFLLKLDFPVYNFIF